MSTNALNISLAVGWVAIQGGIIYYHIPPYLAIRAAFRMLSQGPHDYAYRVALDRLRGQHWRFGAIAGYIVVGFSAAIPLPALRLAVGPLLFFGEFVLLRNARADARLVRDLARNGWDTNPEAAAP